jgi:hypothetical protein
MGARFSHVTGFPVATANGSDEHGKDARTTNAVADHIG